MKPAGQSVNTPESSSTPITGFKESLRQLAVDVNRGNGPSKLREKLNSRKSEAGFINTEILGEVVDYGKTIFRKGMDYLDWSVQMVRDLLVRPAFAHSDAALKS